MRARTWITTLALGTLGLTGCGTAAANRDASMPAIATPSPSATAQAAAATDGKVLFKDDFTDDRNGWGVVDDPVGGRASYAGGDYVWNFTGSFAHVLPETLGKQYDRGELKMRDVTVTADVTVVSGDGVVGVGCRETPDTDANFQWYEFVARDGFAAIRQADDKGNIDILTQTKQVSLPRAKSFSIEGVCLDESGGRAHLTMRVNGTVVLDVHRSSPLGNGAPSLQAWTHPMHAPMEIRWHDFTIRAITG